MKTPTILAALVVSVAGYALPSCAGKQETAAAQPAAEEPILPPGEVDIPSQEEADQAAEKSIDDANADAELEKLEKELEGGGG